MYVNTTSMRDYATKLVNSKYAWTKGVLHENDCFCVEGAICDLSRLGTWEPSRMLAYLDRKAQRYVIDGMFPTDEYVGVMPPMVEESFFGVVGEENCARVAQALYEQLRQVLRERNPELFSYHRGLSMYNMIALTQLNDVLQLTAQQIGELILAACDKLDAAAFV